MSDDREAALDALRRAADLLEREPNARVRYEVTITRPPSAAAFRHQLIAGLAEAEHSVTTIRCDL